MFRHVMTAALVVAGGLTTSPAARAGFQYRFATVSDMQVGTTQPVHVFLDYLGPPPGSNTLAAPGLREAITSLRQLIAAGGTVTVANPSLVGDVFVNPDFNASFATPDTGAEAGYTGLARLDANQTLTIPPAPLTHVFVGRGALLRSSLAEPLQDGDAFLFTDEPAHEVTAGVPSELLVWQFG